MERVKKNWVSEKRTDDLKSERDFISEEYTVKEWNVEGKLGRQGEIRY